MRKNTFKKMLNELKTVNEPTIYNDIRNVSYGEGCDGIKLCFSCEDDKNLSEINKILKKYGQVAEWTGNDNDASVFVHVVGAKYIPYGFGTMKLAI